jgi:hypothetical protein
MCPNRNTSPAKKNLEKDHTVHACMYSLQPQLNTSPARGVDNFFFLHCPTLRMYPLQPQLNTSPARKVAETS